MSGRDAVVARVEGPVHEESVQRLSIQVFRQWCRNAGKRISVQPREVVSQLYASNVSGLLSRWRLRPRDGSHEACQSNNSANVSALSPCTLRVPLGYDILVAKQGAGVCGTRTSEPSLRTASARGTSQITLHP